MKPLRIGTRGSSLALWQARHVAGRLEALELARSMELVVIETSGDRVRDLPLSQVGGDGVFTREIQAALLREEVDVAVHSLKDLPTISVAGLTLAAVPPRADPRDAFVSSRHPTFDSLPSAAIVGTSSLRRRSQALHRRPDLRVVNLRGNVETRLRKLDSEGLDAIILARAGLERLGLGHFIRELLDPAWMLPAVGQGALGLESRVDDCETLSLLRYLDDPPTRLAVLAERSLLRSLGGGCLVPLGVRTQLNGQRLLLAAGVLSPDGRQSVAGEIEGDAAQPEDIGARLADLLRGQGAEAVLSLARPATGS